MNRLFAKLRKAQGGQQAEEQATEIRAFLVNKNALARELEEAGEDLLQHFHLEVPNTLHRLLLSTNCIENACKNLRRHLGRVCRWREHTDQADHWMASGLQLAQKGFRRIVGCPRTCIDSPKRLSTLKRRREKIFQSRRSAPASPG